MILTFKKKTLIGIFLVIITISGLFGIAISRVNPIDYLIVKGDQYLSEGSYEKAIETFEVVIRKDSQSIKGYLGIADAYSALNEYAKAEFYIDKGLEVLNFDESLARKKEEINALMSMDMSDMKSEKSEVELEDVSTIEKEVEFINDYSINIAEYEEFDRLIDDIDGNGEDEVLLLLGKGERTYLDECYLVILDARESKILTIYEGGTYDVSINQVVDITGDGIKDIVIGAHSGGTAGGWQYELIFRDGRYEKLEYVNNSYVNSGFLDGFKYFYSANVGGEVVTKTINLLSEDIKELVSEGIYTNSGQYISIAHEVNKSIGTGYVDINEDGKKEIISSNTVTVTCNGCSQIIENRIYQYTESGAELIDFYLYSASENYMNNQDIYVQVPDYFEYLSVTEAKSLFYKTFNASEDYVRLRYCDNPLILDGIEYDLNDTYYVFEVMLNPLETKYVTDDHLLINKETNEFKYIDQNGVILRAE